jgi:hypothetical protein
MFENTNAEKKQTPGPLIKVKGNSNLISVIT